MKQATVLVCVKQYTRDVRKVRGLTLLLRFVTFWRCCDGLFLEAAPLGSDAFLTTLHPLLENVLQTVCASFRRIVEQAELPFHVWKGPEIAWGRDLDSTGLMDEL
jgi:hypothetical protein